MSISIRTRLQLLVLSVLLPATIAGTWIVVRTYRAENAALERNLRDTTRALSMVVDRELTQRAAIARVLAGSFAAERPGALQGEALAPFDQQARRAMQGLAGWVELRSADTEWLNTRLPAGTGPQPRHAGAPPLEQVATAGELEPAADGALHAAIVQPIRRDGRPLLNLAVTILPSELQRIVDDQNLPDGWVGTVVDRRGAIVARHPGGAAAVGRLAPPELRRLREQRGEGLFESMSLDGLPVMGYFSTSPQGWTYGTAMPRQVIAGFLPIALLQLVIGALVLLGTAVLSALWVAGRIVGPINSLKETAARMQARLPVLHRPTGIEECDRVAAVLAEAAEAMQHTQAELERQVAQAVEQTRAAEQRVSHSQRVEALGRLTGGVAHDFNNLLGIVSNSAYLIQRHAEQPEVKMPVAAMLRAVDVGSRLTQHLLRFAGRHPTRPEQVDLARYLPDVLELMKVVLGKRIEVTAAVAPNTRCIKVDFSELELALINLALNARDALPSGGHVWLNARNAPADDAAELPPRDYVLITISDDGVGVDDSVVGRVFEPFFTTKPVGSGTGLGLSQVHGFCAQAGGRARLASTPGMGTTVSLVLPASDGADARGEAAPPSAADERMRGVRLLLVEDNEELASVTAVLLASYGAAVETANGPARALQKIDAGAAFDIVLSDIVMPGDMDGVRFAREARRRRPQLPVVLISGYSSALASAQEFTVLHKPCAPETLINALGDAIAAAVPK